LPKVKAADRDLNNKLYEVTRHGLKKDLQDRMDAGIIRPKNNERGEIMFGAYFDRKYSEGKEAYVLN
jgi:hypothetical protein